MKSQRCIFQFLAFQGKLTIAQAERATSDWMKEEPDNPVPYEVMAVTLFKRGEQLDRAEALVEKALDFFLEGNMRIYGDVRGQIATIELPHVFRAAAEIHFANGHWAQALSSARMCASLTKDLRRRPRDRRARLAEAWQPEECPDRFRGSLSARLEGLGRAAQGDL